MSFENFGGWFRFGMDHRFRLGLLRHGKRARIHPGQLAGGLLDRAVEEPKEPRDEDDMDQGNDDERPAEAGVLAGSSLLTVAASRPDSRAVS